MWSIDEYDLSKGAGREDRGGYASDCLVRLCITTTRLCGRRFGFFPIEESERTVASLWPALIVAQHWMFVRVSGDIDDYDSPLLGLHANAIGGGLANTRQTHSWTTKVGT